MGQVERLARREREVAEAVYAMGEASACEVAGALSDALSNSAVRSMLGRLEAKGVLRHRREGKKYYYRPAATERKECEAALRRVSREFFGGSLTAAAAAMVELAMRTRPPATAAPEREPEPAPMARERLRRASRH